MSVNTIYESKKPSHTKVIFYGLLLIGVAAVIYFGSEFFSNLFLNRGSATLSASLTRDSAAELYIDDSFVSNVPVESIEVRPGDRNITIKNNEMSYSTRIPFTANTEVVISRELGVSSLFSSGQSFWLTKSTTGTVLSVVTEPSGASVFVDGIMLGTSPFSSDALTPATYDLRVEYPGYESQSARIDINNDFTLNSLISMFPVPAPDEVILLEGSDTLYDLYVENPVVNSDYLGWLKGFIYWNNSRNAGLDFDFYLDPDGVLYDARGVEINPEEAIFDSESRGAYLRNSGDPVLTDAARDAFLSMGQTVSSGEVATVLNTGVGWLRVRSAPSLNAAEVTRVTVGEKYDVLEKTPGWVKLRVSETVEGWVSDTYISIE